MNRRALSPFEQIALASGLLKQEQLDEARCALRATAGAHGWGDSPTDEQLAEKLVELGRLNLWQSKQLLEGRTKFNLGPYWMIDWIGRGGMGQVFKARHGLLGRVVAVKVLPRSKSTPASVANFLREIQVLAKLDHPNLVRALDAGEDGNVYYLVTEYVPGSDLRKLVRRNGPLSMRAAAGIISQAAAGLQHAHEQGLVHRDVKPGNLLVTPDGRTKLSDLGLAGSLDADATTDPRFGKIVGTADYLSPDHIQSPWNPTPAWDIYALGCTLYYAVTGKVPFPGGTTAEKVRAHCELRPLDPRRLNPTLTLPFVELLADMMAKDPAQRVQTAEAVVARLAAWVEPIPIPASEQAAYGPPASTFGRAIGRWTRLRWSDDAKSRPAEPSGPPESGMADTQSIFPEIPDVPTSHSDLSGEASQTTSPVASARQDTSPLEQSDDDQPRQPLPLFHPLVVLVLFPIALVGLVMLVSWLVRMML